MRRLLLAIIVGATLYAITPVALGAESIGYTVRPAAVKISCPPPSGGLYVDVRFLDPSGITQFVRVRNLPNGLGVSLKYSLKKPTEKPGSCVRINDDELPETVMSDANTSTALLHDQRFLIQLWQRNTKDFGGTFDKARYTIYVSTWGPNFNLAGNPTLTNSNPGRPLTQSSYDLPPLGLQEFDGFPTLLAYPRWSKFSPGGYQGYLHGKHFPTIFGSFTYSGLPVFGPGDRNGKPTNALGRNVYIDTFDSDYGPGWRRIMGVLTQKPSGTFCYEFSPKGASKGLTGQSKSHKYRLTVIGPAATPVLRIPIAGPTFPFGNDVYDAKRNKWGLNFSIDQHQALVNQMAMIGPSYLTKPPKGTDCGETLRQLPTPF